MSYNILKMTTVVLLINIVTVPLLMAEDKQILFPTFANFVSEKEPNNVNKNSQTLIVKGAKDYTRGTYLKFENVTFQNKSIQKAELVLECEKLGNEGTKDVHFLVGDVDASWNPDKMNWKNSPVPKSTVGKTTVKTWTGAAGIKYHPNSK